MNANHYQLQMGFITRQYGFLIVLKKANLISHLAHFLGKVVANRPRISSG